ncbi:MAG: hypothetical protein EB127_15905 [Alphaproteobacteria bacterium]|nr:hypothetical protein [Alphaproteobacteria bacterium]
MQQINNGDLEKLELVIVKNNEHVDADGSVTVELFNADDTSNTVLTSGSATNESITGVYSFQIGPDITSLNKIVRAEWSYSIDSSSVVQSTFHEILTPYATISDIIDYYNFGVQPSDLNYRPFEEIRNAERLARTVIDGYTGQKFGKRTGWQEVFGNGSDACFMTEPMIQLDKMYENDIVVYDAISSPSVNQFGFELMITQTGKTVRIVNAGWDVRYDNNIDPSILYYGRFRNNSRYKFEGIIGWNYVPANVKLSTILLAGDYLANDAAWRIKYLKEVSLSEITFKMAPGAFNGTGNLLVDNMLDMYRNVGIVII